MREKLRAVVGRYAAGLHYWLLAAICGACAGLVGVIDVYTGDYVITIVYLLPIYISAKLLGSRECMVFTALSVIILMGSAYLTHREQINLSEVYFWNALLQAVLLAITGFIISQFTRPATFRTTRNI